MKYAAVVCPKCGMASATRLDAKRHVCPYCGRLIDLDRAPIIYSGSAREVRKAVAEYNSRRPR
ncbi:hypothetical protein [Thermoproteus tenax]|uniref:DUF1922 domain-containing protein n=1 Tax=Thermoproteus tenax (strain ATCC 35583 / DSM 2078 / JCM 9277 / NBRC 100435 / Kra 1) TaxID=768679 RepID=G4RNJ6_THETK|nr:hypothetical protein [Thermoproteus tenax]CCC81140.1 hypothetical protein TTX_0473 [Thermoproteus tenax Kra 1]